MSEENKALINRWFEEVWNRGDAEAIDELLAEDGVVHGLVDANGNPVRGLAAFHDFHSQFRGAFPDIVVTLEDVIAEGDRVVARCSVRGTPYWKRTGLCTYQCPGSIRRHCDRANREWKDC